MRISLSLLLVLGAAACGAAGEAPDAGSAEIADAGAIDAVPGNATLAALTASAGVLDPPFEPEVTEYDLDLLLAEDTVTLTPTAASAAGVTITIDGAAVAAGAASDSLAPQPGSRDVDVIVTAGDGSAATYRIHLHRGVDALSGLAPSVGALRPAFAPATTSYALPLAITQPSATFTPALLIPGRATVAVGGAAVASGSTSAPIALAPGPNPIAVVVTPATRPARTYAIDAGRGADALASIALSSDGGVMTNPLAPAFAPTVGTYAVDIGLVVERISIAVTPLIEGAQLSVAGTVVQPGSPSPAIQLNLGLTPVEIVVDAGDGLRRSYMVELTRAGPIAQRAYGKASNTGAWDTFGTAVALYGDTLAVAAGSEGSSALGVGGDQSDDSAPFAGAVYVFTRTGGAWTQQAYLKASNTGANDFFGSSLALWGDTLAVGADSEDSAATGVGGNQGDNSAQRAGAVYVFTRTGSTWSQQAYLKASNAGADDAFGHSLSMWGETLAVSAYGEDSSATGVNGNQADNSAESAGAVYVFTRTGVLWSQQAYLKASNTDALDAFGHAVALSGDTLVATALYEDSAATVIDGNQADNSAASCGAAYVFTRTGSTWSQQAYLKGEMGLPDNAFGYAAAAWGDTIAIGAMQEQFGSLGAVFVFMRTGTGWVRSSRLRPAAAGAGDRFGTRVSLWGDTLAVGAPYEDSAATGLDGDQADNSAPDSGAVYVYRRETVQFPDELITTWRPTSYVKASNTAADDRFGFIALWGDTLAVGAYYEDSAATGVGGDQSSDAAAGSGAVYLFR